MNQTVRLKAQQIARLIVQGVPKSKIAIEMGMSYDGVLRITKTEEYLQIEDEVQSKTLGHMDARLEKRSQIRQVMNDEMEDEAVPEAWQIVLDNLRKKRDLKSALEILDRDPKRQFAKGAAAKPVAPEEAARKPLDPTVLKDVMAESRKTFDILQRNAQQQKPAEA